MGADIDSGLGWIAIGSFEVEEGRNLLKLLREGPCRHGAAHASAGIGNIHPGGIGSNRIRLPFEMVFFGSKMLISGPFDPILRFDRPLVRIGLNQHEVSP